MSVKLGILRTELLNLQSWQLDQYVLLCMNGTHKTHALKFIGDEFVECINNTTHARVYNHYKDSAIMVADSIVNTDFWNMIVDHRISIYYDYYTELWNTTCNGCRVSHPVAKIAVKIAFVLGKYYEV
ncbi:hypothetical protein MM5_158 [Morganella phage vB_Mm5]